MATGVGASLVDLARQARAEAETLDRELEEIALLIAQARIESGRHEQKRAQTAERVAGLESRQASAAEIREALDQLVLVNRRASLMEAQIEVLEGKQKALTRFRDTIAPLADQLQGFADATTHLGTGESALVTSRTIASAQEDLRRDIARAMHDGPAQSLTNIALQAQIVQRLMAQDPQRAEAEVGQLVAMVQHTLEATKTFIFDVRPMVLDDLGLVPTLRRAARDRGRKAQVPIDFDSVGPDRRLGVEVESALFRIIDDAITGYLTTHPSRIAVRLDWTDAEVRARVAGVHVDEEGMPSGAGPAAPEREAAAPHAADLPPALAAMIDERRHGEDVATAAASAAVTEARALPPQTWRAVQQRARTVGIEVDLEADGRELTARTAFD